MKFFIFIGLFISAGLSHAAPPEGLDLEVKRPLPNQHPFYDIAVFEEYDEKSGLILRRQTWTEQVRVSVDVLGADRRWYRQWQTEYRAGSKVLSTRAVPKPSIPSRAPTGTTREGWEAPKNSKEMEVIPNQEEPKPQGNPFPRPGALVKNEPESLRSIAWGIGKDHRPDPLELLPVLESLKISILDWQADMHGRFGLCPVDKVEAMENGTLEKLYVPYQVASGRIYLVKAQLDSLIYELKTGPTDQTAGKVMRLLRRLESMESQLELLTEKKEQKYYAPILQAKRDLQEQTMEFSPRIGSDKRVWALRWQVLAEDLNVLIERFSKVESQLGPKSKQILGKIRHRWNDLNRDIGDKPWLKEFRQQEQLVRRAYDSAQSFYVLYEEISDRADEDGIAPREYLPLLAALGANEDLRVISFTMLSVLSQ